MTPSWPPFVLQPPHRLFARCSSVASGRPSMVLARSLKLRPELVRGLMCLTSARTVPVPGISMGPS